MTQPWPDRAQRLLLHAALDDGPQALAAFREWRTAFDIEGPIDEGSFRLLPLVEANLRRLGADDPLMGRLRGIYRHFWCSVQCVLSPAFRAIGDLRAAGVPVLANKGLALATCYYDSPALRPMNDVDIMVPVSQFAEASALLRGGGWRARGAFRPGATARNIVAVRHAIDFVNADDVHIDVHWRPVHELGSRAAIEDFWASAAPMALFGAQLLRPSATHLLLQVILHGLRDQPVAPLRWITDVVMIMRKEGEAIAWDELIAFARRERKIHRLAIALRYLADEFAVAIPPRVLADLERRRPTLAERLEHRLLMLPPVKAGHWLKPLYAAIVMRMVMDGRSGDLPGVVAGALGARLRAATQRPS